MKQLSFLLSLLLMISCQPPLKQEQSGNQESVEDKADRLAHELMLIDTHVDVPYRLEEKWEDISGRTQNGHFDFVRAQQGGLDAPFMSIYVAAGYQETGGAKEKADELIDLVNSFVEKWPDKYVIALSSSNVIEQFGKGKISLPMGMENGAPIEDDIQNVAYFYGRGIRYITLCHSKWNQICDSSYDPDRHWNGLSPFGEKVITEMNRLGILVDISHVSDSTFYQALKITKAPLIASHSSCRYFTPGFERNMSDDMIRRLADNGGVIQINFGSDFINGDFQRKMKKAWDYIESHPELSEEEGYTYVSQYMKDNAVPAVGIEEVADHIDHVVDLVGIDYVGIGSDFDGVYILPEGLSDVSMYPHLIQVLLERGYTEEDIEKIGSGNFLRVWKEAESIAEELHEKV